MKRFVLFLLVALVSILFLSACSAAPTAVQKVVEMPNQLQAVLAAGVAWLVRLLLSGRVPEDYLNEIAVAITSALITVVGVFLRLIPVELEGIAFALLNLVVVLLGTAWVFGLLRKGAVRAGLLKA